MSQGRSTERLARTEFEMHTLGGQSCLGVELRSSSPAPTVDADCGTNCRCNGENGMLVTGRMDCDYTKLSATTLSRVRRAACIGEPLDLRLVIRIAKARHTLPVQHGERGHDGRKITRKPDLPHRLFATPRRPVQSL